MTQQAVGHTTVKANLAEVGHGELVRRAADGNREALEELVHRFRPLVECTVRRNGLSPSDAADATQVTWLRLVQHIGAIRQPECLPQWLITTARRESLRVAMGGSREVPSADPLADCGGANGCYTSDIYPVEGEFGPSLENALNRLPTKYQTLLRLLMRDDFHSYEDIADRTGMPIGSIGPMRMRGLGLLRATPEFAA